ncbi:hypothetical protein [Kangiella aquimarina]|uniref:Uncharacterized protein n=1 Tax=Kangiella aquimarina TaxID=261965 RepID=A0ABZ0X5R4_9GAMM|nr:hypothetical protein [Kangiella aquimarina]WQG85602.1 hypothetical protein SR900_01660 [Kangiella aquimarina]
MKLIQLLCLFLLCSSLKADRAEEFDIGLEILWNTAVKEEKKVLFSPEAFKISDLLTQEGESGVIYVSADVVVYDEKNARALVSFWCKTLSSEDREFIGTQEANIITVPKSEILEVECGYGYNLKLRLVNKSLLGT